MQRCFSSVLLVALTLVCTGSVSAQELPVAGAVLGSSADYYGQLIQGITGDWQQYGELFTMLQSQWFYKIFLVVVTAVPAVFLIHYLIIGAKHFDHDGEQIYFFSLFARVVHFIAAVSFSLLVVTGLLIVFGSFFGGGLFIRSARYIHLISAIAFVVPGLLMFVMWLKDMLPQLHDIKWMFILGGYLSKKKKPVPAAKFNAGQKMYFWFATLGGGIMAYTGYLIWGFGASLDIVRLSTMLHNVLGVGIVAFFLTHVYMSVFAIAGSLESMKTGYKPKDEVDILHSLYKY